MAQGSLLSSAWTEVVWHLMGRDAGMSECLLINTSPCIFCAARWQPCFCLKFSGGYTTNVPIAYGVGIPSSPP